MATKRLMQEFSTVKKELSKKEILKDGQYQNIISLEPLDDLFNWKSKIQGPKNSPFEHGIWELTIVVPSDYPIKPPKISFVNKICHPNVNFQTGEICLDILQAQWTPAWTLLSTLTAILLLIQDPEPNSPLNVDISNLLKNGDKKGYDGLIKYYTHKYALSL